MFRAFLGHDHPDSRSASRFPMFAGQPFGHQFPILDGYGKVDFARSESGP